MPGDTTATKKPEKKRAIPKPGKRQSFEAAKAATLKQYAETFAKLAK